MHCWLRLRRHAWQGGLGAYVSNWGGLRILHECDDCGARKWVPS